MIVVGPHLQWQRQRSILNHDWLKNVYLPALDTWLNVLAGTVEDPEFEEIFVDGRLRDWPRNLPLLKSLLSSFEDKMSPAAWFNREPLSLISAENRSWLKPLIHDLWRVRVSAPKLLSEATARLAECDERYFQLINVVEARGRTDAAGLANCYREFDKFGDACRALARALSQFPNRVEFA